MNSSLDTTDIMPANISDQTSLIIPTAQTRVIEFFNPSHPQLIGLPKEQSMQSRIKELADHAILFHQQLLWKLYISFKIINQSLYLNKQSLIAHSLKPMETKDVMEEPIKDLLISLEITVSQQKLIMIILGTLSISQAFSTTKKNVHHTAQHLKMLDMLKWLLTMR